MIAGKTRVPKDSAIERLIRTQGRNHTPILGVKVDQTELTLLGRNAGGRNCFSTVKSVLLL